MKDKRVIQLIDSLHIGGAEKVAVTLANTLAETMPSYIAVTRAEGPLKSQLSNKVNFSYLEKKRSLDLQTVFKFRKYLKTQQIDIIHAHGTSFFFATLIKIVYPKIGVIWHDHNGNRKNTSFVKRIILQLCSFFFCAIITVNKELEIWAKKYLHTKNICQINNFIKNTEGLAPAKTLKGENGKRIVCVANLRKEKNHFNLVAACKMVLEVHSDWTVHLVGEDKQDEYSEKLKEKIKKVNLENNLFIEGAQTNISGILEQCTIGVLSSDSEALPMALLEYGFHNLAVIVTNVGECPYVVKENGWIVPTKDSEALAAAMLEAINNNNLRTTKASHYKEYVKQHYGASAVINKIISVYNQC